MLDESKIVAQYAAAGSLMCKCEYFRFGVGEQGAPHVHLIDGPRGVASISEVRMGG